MKRIEWNQIIVSEFKKTACLSAEEEILLDMRVKEYPNSVIADTMGISERTVQRKVQKLLSKYDGAQAINKNLPKRRKSAKELWMDTH